MKTLEVVETIRYRFQVPDEVTDETAEDWFTDIDCSERDNGCVGIEDRSVELT